MPPKKFATSAVKATKLRMTVRPKGKGKKDAEVDAEVKVEEVAKVLTPADIFPTITINAPPGAVKGGLNIIRPLGDGKYEIVNLGTIDQNLLGSEETAQFIKSDPERLAAMSVSKKDWDSAILKCEVAVRVTEADLFRIFKLPTEIREKIIKYIVTPSKGMRYSRNPRGNNPALSLMLTCRQMYAESKGLFWSNSFCVDHMDLGTLRKIGPDNHFFNNVQKLTYHWNDNIRDPTAFRFINKFHQLRELQLDFNVFIFEIHDKYGTRNRNRICQNEESFGRLRVLTGFDTLLEIRGLQRVSINLIGTKYPAGEEKKIKDAAKSLEAYLMRTLTLPMALPKPKKVAKGGAKAKGKGKARTSESEEMSDDEETEEESDEEVIIPRKSRSRASKAIADSSSELGDRNE